MSWMWRELSPTDSWSVMTYKPLQTAEIGVLMHLYQPIIGAEAVSLYTTLCMQGAFLTASESPSHTHRFLMGLLCLPLDQVLAARWQLEGIGLLKTFKQTTEWGRSFRYEVIPPLEAGRFFQQDVLSITLMNRLGKEQFRQIRERFCPVKRKRPPSAEELTKPFHEVFTSLTPSELTISKDSEMGGVLADMEAAPVGEAASGPTFTGITLDWEFLSMQASAVGTLDDLTEAERQKICEWAFFYQLDELALGKALQNPEIYNNQNQLEADRLHAFIKQEYRFHHGRSPSIRLVDKKPPVAEAETTEAEGASMEDVHRKWLARLSPLELLERYQQGGKVPEADVKLVEKLYEQYGLPYPVINVLIEFVLLTHHYKLPASLVEKIAGHWKRVNPQTVEEAQELALKELYARKGQKDRQKQGVTSARKKGRNPSGKQTQTAFKSSQQASDQAKQDVAETEEERQRRKAKFEGLLNQLQQARAEADTSLASKKSR